VGLRLGREWPHQCLPPPSRLHPRGPRQPQARERRTEAVRVRHLGVYSCSLEGCSPYTANLAVLGERGTILNDRFFLKRFQGQADYFTLDTGGRKTGDVYGHPFAAMVDHFVACIREGRESPHNLADAVNAHLACLGIRLSAERGGELVRIDSHGLGS
jgi:predicted dehydrogenase